tara:strand:- start:2309 stop:3469 length:1161 start_codon:yes stop_codon:yes gene_type:complete
MFKKNLCIITGSRAEYGLLSRLCKLIKKDKRFNLQIIVTGSHLSKEHGNTINEIKKDNLKINKKIANLISSDRKTDMIKSTGIALIKFSKVIKKLNPYLVIVLGDRYEIFSATIASYFLNVPIAHIHGGELTYGAIDDAIRHSITKMSWFHFVATKNYKKRVIQLGENNKRVFNVGSLGVENIKKTKLITKKNIEKKLNIKFKDRNLLIAYHPETIDKNFSSNGFKEILKSLENLDYTFLIFTAPNADAGGLLIKKEIYKFVKKNPYKAIFFASLGSLNFLSLLNIVDGIIGNSSSGIIEAPSLQTGTINIGKRQNGRDMSSSIINCKPNKKSIEKSLKILFSDKYIRSLKSISNIYEKKDTSIKIFNKIKNTAIPKNLNKIFNDL